MLAVMYEEIREEKPKCSLYITANSDEPLDIYNGRTISRECLERAIQNLEPIGEWQVTETSCGLIANFTHEDDADALLSINLTVALGGPVQVARFGSNDNRYRQTIILRDIHWQIPLQDISTALHQQGISPTNIERTRMNVKVELTDPLEYESLLRNGLNFFGAALFMAQPERWRATAINRSLNNAGDNNSILQCYRCQGFWHIAANCRHLQRCVRCGDSHSVHYCPRPRNEPLCCHCAGPHHAASKHCPVRLQLLNAAPVSITLSTSRLPAKVLRSYNQNNSR